MFHSLLVKSCAYALLTLSFLACADDQAAHTPEADDAHGASGSYNDIADPSADSADPHAHSQDTCDQRRAACDADNTPHENSANQPVPPSDNMNEHGFGNDGANTPGSHSGNGNGDAPNGAHDHNAQPAPPEHEDAANNDQQPDPAASPRNGDEQFLANAVPAQNLEHTAIGDCLNANQLGPSFLRAQVPGGCVTAV